MKRTTLMAAAILAIGLCSVSITQAGDSSYLEERSARLHQESSDMQQARTHRMTSAERLRAREHRQETPDGLSPLQPERWWK